MIGRRDTLHPNTNNYIYVIGSDRLSSELHDINEAVNTKYTQLELDYKYNDRKDPKEYISVQTTITLQKRDSLQFFSLMEYMQIITYQVILRQN